MPQRTDSLRSFSKNSCKMCIRDRAYLDAKGIEYVEQTANTNDEVVAAASALIADGVDAVFTPVSYTHLDVYKRQDEYIDDGWSGTNFERPSFQRMIDDIEDGKINCVVTTVSYTHLVHFNNTFSFTRRSIGCIDFDNVSFL